MAGERRQSGQWFFGLVLLIIGLLFLLENIANIRVWDKIWMLWPVIFIVWGLMELFQKHSVFFGIILLAIGALFLTKNYGYYQWSESIWQFWPVIIIALGIDQIFKRSGEYTFKKRTNVINKKSQQKDRDITQDDEII